MDIKNILAEEITAAVKSVFDHKLDPKHALISPTKKEFEGAYTFVVFPLVKVLRNSPENIANQLGEYLVENSEHITAFNVIKGFLNLSLDNKLWNAILKSILENKDFGQHPSNDKTIVVEYSSPNTNKPLHLGHLRNIFLGWSISKIAKAAGYKVVKTKVVNDRGIAICKSMLSWQKFAEGVTPESSKTKGDHFVGDYYVKFEQAFREEYTNWQNNEGEAVFKSNAKDGEDAAAFYKRYKNTYFNEHSQLGGEARKMLLDWESGEPNTIALWKKMNGWVYDGFNKTYGALGVDFNDIVYESDTYLLGKEYVLQGLKDNVFYQKPDNSIWVDLEEEGMDQKIVLRSDGTSVYITQDIGTAKVRHDKFSFDNMVYVVADEQDYHFQVLKQVLKKLGEPYADNLFHLSYGMVELTTGKMKSREGTVVDADDLIEEVKQMARTSADERGGLSELSEEERQSIFEKIGLGALKYYILKINPRKWMTFNPEDSVDMQGATAPYIQNAFVRIQSIFRKGGEVSTDWNREVALSNQEKELIVLLSSFPEEISEAMQKYDPSVIATYTFNLAKAYHKFYHDHRILGAEDPSVKQMRLALSKTVANIIEKSSDLLGIGMPNYM